MSDLDNLRPEVREAVAAIDKGNGVFVNGDDCEGGIAWATVRAELLRLAQENADLRSSIELDEQVWIQRDETMHKWIERARKAESELAALKARIAKPVDRSHKYVQSKEHGGCSECGYPEWEPWHRVALVKVED